METSDSISKIAPALLAAQKNIKGAVKDSENPHFHSKYADLASVSDACKGPLNDAGISILQTTKPDDSKLTLVTTLLHESGEWVRGTMSLPTVKADPQAYGSALSYARRYSLAAIIGVCPEDDDAEGAAEREKPQSKAASKPAPRQAAPSTKPRPPAVPAGLDFRPSFGSGKGKPLSELDDNSIDWYMKVFSENLSDPSKARWKSQNHDALEAMQAEKARRNGDNDIQDDPLEEVFGGGKGSVAHKLQPPVKPDKDAWVKALREAPDFDSLKGLVSAIKLKAEDDFEYAALQLDKDIHAAFRARDQELKS